MWSLRTVLLLLLLVCTVTCTDLMCCEMEDSGCMKNDEGACSCGIKGYLKCRWIVFRDRIKAAVKKALVEIVPSTDALIEAVDSGVEAGLETLSNLGKRDEGSSLEAEIRKISRRDADSFFIAHAKCCDPSSSPSTSPHCSLQHEVCQCPLHMLGKHKRMDECPKVVPARPKRQALFLRTFVGRGPCCTETDGLSDLWTVGRRFCKMTESQCVCQESPEARLCRLPPLMDGWYEADHTCCDLFNSDRIVPSNTRISAAVKEGECTLQDKTRCICRGNKTRDICEKGRGMENHKQRVRPRSIIYKIPVGDDSDVAGAETMKIQSTFWGKNVCCQKKKGFEQEYIVGRHYCKNVNKNCMCEDHTVAAKVCRLPEIKDGWFHAAQICCDLFDPALARFFHVLLPLAIFDGECKMSAGTMCVCKDNDFSFLCELLDEDTDSSTLDDPFE